jgi:hypothetical protein
LKRKAQLREEAQAAGIGSAGLAAPDATRHGSRANVADRGQGSFRPTLAGLESHRAEWQETGYCSAASGIGRVPALEPNAPPHRKVVESAALPFRTRGPTLAQ